MKVVHILSDSETPNAERIAKYLLQNGYVPKHIFNQDIHNLDVHTHVLLWLVNESGKKHEENSVLLMEHGVRNLAALAESSVTEQINQNDAVGCKSNDECVQLLQRLRRLCEGLDEAGSEEAIELKLIGSTPCFKEIIKRTKQFSRCDAPVLIEGETGTGKELIARAIHYYSKRSDAPFIPINCGALPDTLVENELFGHKKGAYTDARDDYLGLVSQAEGGTLFLDEVEALTSKGQIALLRFLQEKEFRPLGAKGQVKANVRIIAASNTSLESLVEECQFRNDLWYRLNIMPLFLPPLRMRRGDLSALIEHFMGGFRGQYKQPDRYLGRKTLEWMYQYEWPGNVRELENFIHREFLLAEDECIQPKLSTNKIDDAKQALSGINSALLNIDCRRKFSDAKTSLITQFEKEYLTGIMEQSNGNVSLAAKRAGKERRSFGKLLKKHGIVRECFV